MKKVQVGSVILW